MAPQACNGASVPEGQQSAYLPLWPASDALQRLYGLCAELASAWESTGAEDAQRLADTEAVAAAAAAEAAARLQELKSRATELEARCGPLLAEVEAGRSALGDSAGPLASQLAEAAKAPMRKRAAALETLLPELRKRLHAQRGEQLQVLGRTPEAEAEGGSAALGPELLRLREAVQERRAAAARARGRLHGLWKELSAQLPEAQDPEDAAVRAGGDSYGVPDAEHEVLTRRLAFWESQRSQQQQQQVMDRHGRIRELGLAVLPQGDLAGLSGFLEAHAQSSDATALQAKELELESAAGAQVQALEQRRRAAAVALQRPAVDEAPRVGDVLLRMRALSAEVEQLEGELGARRNAAFEAARRAKALWDELGEAPEEPRDLEVTRVLAAGADAGSVDLRDVVATAAAAEASCKAWEAQRAAAAEELATLRKELEGLGMPETVGPFLAQRGTLRREDRAACRSKLEELRAAVLRAEEEKRREPPEGASAEEEDDSDSSTSDAEATGAGKAAPAEAPRKLAMPAELEAAAAKALAALQAKLAAVRSAPPPFALDIGGEGDEGADSGRGTSEGGKVKEKEEKKKKKDKDRKEKEKEKGEKRKKKADRSKSRKRKAASDSSSESGKSHKRKRSRSRKKKEKEKEKEKDKEKEKEKEREKEKEKGRSAKKHGHSKKHDKSPSSSESESGSASSESQPKKKKKAAHSGRHGRRSKSKSRRRGR